MKKKIKSKIKIWKIQLFKDEIPPFSYPISWTYIAGSTLEEPLLDRVGLGSKYFYIKSKSIGSTNFAQISYRGTDTYSHTYIYEEVL